MSKFESEPRKEEPQRDLDLLLPGLLGLFLVTIIFINTMSKDPKCETIEEAQNSENILDNPAIVRLLNDIEDLTEKFGNSLKVLEEVLEKNPGTPSERLKIPEVVEALNIASELKKQLQGLFNSLAEISEGNFEDKESIVMLPVMLKSIGSNIEFSKIEEQLKN